MARTGFDRNTGKLVYGWEHTVQSIGVILTTELSSRLQRRQFGSRIPDLIDRPQNLETLMDLYMAAAEALVPRVVDGALFGEPCFELTNIGISPSATGLAGLVLEGNYYPNGHLGDFSVVETRSGVLVNI